MVCKKVSVMIPVYNQEDYVKECLDSILSQDYQNIELVVIDDCSTDSTKEVLQSYQGNSKVKLVFNDVNLGMTRNADKALGMCTGDYVCLFAGDDVMLPGKISSQVRVLDSDPDAACCYHRVIIFQSETDEVILVTERKRTIFSFFDVIENLGIPGSNSLMVRRSALPLDGYNKKLPNVSDWMLFIDISLRGKIVFISEVFSKYRKHNKGASMLSYSFLNETYETLEIIKSRFNFDPRIVKSCTKAWHRYLVGEIARLIRRDEHNMLRELHERYIKSKFLTMSLALKIYLGLKLYKLKLGGFVYNFAYKFR